VHQRRHPGDVVVLREIWRGSIFHARPAVVVADRSDTGSFYVPAGVLVRVATDADGRPKRMPDGEWRLDERRRGHRDVLSFAWPDRAYAVLLFWLAESRAFGGWYVNLQTPLRRSALGFDFTDHLLDIVVAPNRTWRWKDEDELAGAVDRGLFSAEEGREIRVEGGRAVAALERREAPFDDTWIDWQPDPRWPRPELPPGWSDVR
jgi:predicted RNA-binding protein associated with RNAse of E/G family